MNAKNFKINNQQFSGELPPKAVSSASAKVRLSSSETKTHMRVFFLAYILCSEKWKIPIKF